MLSEWGRRGRARIKVDKARDKAHDKDETMNTIRLIHPSAILFLLLTPALAAAQETQQVPSIPQSEITALQQEVTLGARRSSSVEIRRACKSVIRKANSLLEASADAPNRYAVLGILFQGQKRLLSLETTERNREAIFKTCEKLRTAPDSYAELRLEADLLLSERDLAEAEALVAERIEALEAIMEKYRGTSAERRSLTIAAMIATKLQADDLEQKIRRELARRSFGGDHKAIAFRRRTHSVNRLNAVFSGTYEDSDGTSITFPFDRLGHQYLVVFWSLDPEDREGCEVFLSRVREQQERFPGRFEVYSFNLDELPDAGLSILTRAGVKCTALCLPGGRSSSAYNAYALRDPVAFFVNAQGHVVLRWGQSVPWPRPSPARGKVSASPGPGLGKSLDDERYLAQLRSLFIGDFLVRDQRLATSDQPLASEAQAIQDCFVVPPLRYRLTRKAELDGYRRAAKLCDDAIKKHSQAPDLWRVRNHRIIALLGMWNLAREPKHLEEAVRAAKAMLAMDLPPAAQVVPRFCLAKGVLRRGDADTSGTHLSPAREDARPPERGEGVTNGGRASSRAANGTSGKRLKSAPFGADPEALLSGFVQEVGGDNVPPSALAAAAILAIEANAENLYQEYRQRFLALADEDDPALWPVLSFLRDRHHNYRLFWPNPGRWGDTRRQRYQVKYLISGLAASTRTNRVLEVKFAGLDGQEVRIPDGSAGEMSGIIFAEPPAAESERSAYAKRVKDFAGQFSAKGVPVTVAFLSEEMSSVMSILKECDGSFRPAIVPGGLRNPLVRKEGILSADRIPNPFLLLGDGTMVWSISGLTYPINGSSVEGAVSVSIGINIEKLRTDRAFEALEQGDFKEALSLLDERLPPRMAADPWTHDRLHGRALARMGLSEWEAALKEIDAALERLGKASRYGTRVHPGVVEMHLVRAAILKKLGRVQEAAGERAIAERHLTWLANVKEPFYPPSYARNGTPVEVYVDLLKQVRMGLEAGE